MRERRIFNVCFILDFDVFPISDQVRGRMPGLGLVRKLLTRGSVAPFGHQSLDHLKLFPFETSFKGKQWGMFQKTFVFRLTLVVLGGICKCFV